MELAQVGVRSTKRSRGLALAEAAATSNKRKAENNSQIDQFHSSRRRLLNSSGENYALSSGERTEIEDRCGSPSLDDQESASCCSSNGSSERNKFVDLEDEIVEVERSTYRSCKSERREMTPSSEVREESSSGEVDSTRRPTSSEVNSHRRSKPVTKMPTASELEDFFAEAEKKLHKQFQDKYNYDIVNDKPLGGRYEWIRLKP